MALYSTTDSHSNHTFLAPSSTSPTETAILDSGCSSHFLTSTVSTTNNNPNTDIEVQLPDGSLVTSSHEATIALHTTLPPAAQTAHVLPDLNHSLISIGQLCDAGCTATFNNTTVDCCAWVSAFQRYRPRVPSAA